MPVYRSFALRWLSDAIELRRLRRRLPNAHHAWAGASGRLRPESDAEYLVRLRRLAREREQLRDTTERSSRPGNHTPTPAVQVDQLQMMLITVLAALVGLGILAIFRGWLP
jgi:hypothetical protein